MSTSEEIFDLVIQEIEMAPSNARRKNIRPEYVSLNGTQLDILKNLLEGKTPKEIALNLKMNPRYVSDEIKDKICPQIIKALYYNGRITSEEDLQNKEDPQLTIFKQIERKLKQLVSLSYENGFSIANSAYIKIRCGSLAIVCPSPKQQDESSENERPELQIMSLYVEQNLLEKPKGSIEGFLDKRIFKQILVDGNKTSGEDIKKLVTLKWIVYGRSGCGKTSLLKFLAIKCDKKEFQADRIPIYISLKRYVNHILQEGSQSIFTYLVAAQHDFFYKPLEKNVVDETVVENQLKSLLVEGKMLILLDGLDVSEDENSILVNSVIAFINRFPKNSFIISSREKQSSGFDIFREFVLQDLDKKQKEDFINKRLNCCEKDEQKRGQRLKNFKDILNKDYIKDFVSTPLLLAYLFLIGSSDENLNFLKNKQIKEGENRQIDEGENELRLCKLAVFELLKWDDNPDIIYNKNEIYLNMSVNQRADFLAKLAFKMIEDGTEEYVELSTLVNHSANFLFPVDKAENKEEFRIKSEQFLLAIEAQDGLLTRRIISETPEYSFPHQTVKYFFAAWWLSSLSTAEQKNYWDKYVNSDASLKTSVETTKKWENIFQKALIMTKIRQDELEATYEKLKTIFRTSKK